MPFRYLRDSLFLFCVALYSVNRFILKPHIHGGVFGAFLHGSLNDVICLPFWVPIMVWIMRKTGLRTDDAPPQGVEILIPLLLWSLFFELILPTLGPFRRLATGDPNDILCYTVGAVLAALFWGRCYAAPQKER
jgi:hypothetical protein